MAVAVGISIVVASLVCCLCALGLAAMKTAPDRLHYVGPAATIAPVLVAFAIVLEDGVTSSAGLKSICVAVAIIVTGPFTSYATLRAIQTRAIGRPKPPTEPEVQR